MSYPNPRSKSQKDQNRIPITHKNERVKTLLKNLSVMERIKLNFDIREKNSASYIAQILAQSNSEGDAIIPSDSASQVTVETIEYEEIRKNKDLFDRCKHWLSDKALQCMAKRSKEEEQAEKETGAADGLHAQVSETVPRTMGGDYFAVFSDALDVAVAHCALP
ncbi:hypothetical protein MPER_04499 [Moniliophthora perniciosa FA553]|nr:hypothetical protein MPER_04499 [Moniliophthora perniciosa FA553]